MINQNINLIFDINQNALWLTLILFYELIIILKIAEKTRDVRHRSLITGYFRYLMRNHDIYEMDELLGNVKILLNTTLIPWYIKLYEVVRCLVFPWH